MLGLAPHRHEMSLSFYRGYGDLGQARNGLGLVLPRVAG